MKKRPELPTDDEPKTRLNVIPIARFSHFPYDILARYINHGVEFTVEKDMTETPWTVRKLT